MSTDATTVTILPYLRQGDIDYASLDFNPDDKDLPPDHMEQRREIDEVIYLLTARFTDFDRRPDVFLDRETFACYDPGNLNVRVAPDVYITFGVDAEAVRPRRIYLPWEVQKPPDWVLEVASESTFSVDVNRKPAIYAQIGVPEYWRFDPSGGNYHGAPLYGGRLVNGIYQPVELTTAPDGILKGFSEVLQLSLCWDKGWPRFYDPATGAYLRNFREVEEARLAAEEARLAAEEARLAAEAELSAVHQENRRLREELRRRGEES